MEQHIIRNAKPTCYQHLTRNRYIAAGGISVTACGWTDNQDGEIHLEPVNSKGTISQARIVVHVDQIDALVDALRAAQKELQDRSV